MPQRTVEVAPGETETRLDRLLARAFPDLSRSFLQKLIAAGQVRVNGEPARASARPQPGSQISVTIPNQQATHPAEAIPFGVVYEDDQLLVIDKPAGLVVHPAPGHARGTLVNALLAYDPTLAAGDRARPGIVHRLDKDTSGLMMVARTERARRALQAQLQRHEVRKEYLALVRGVVRPDHGTIEAPIGRDPAHRQRMAVVERGRPARTHFTVRARYAHDTLVEVRLETGRTHQIRVHFAAIGHPIAGDPVYGQRGDLGLARQFLHAHRLAFRHPTRGELLTFESPLPADLATALESLAPTARDLPPTR